MRERFNHCNIILDIVTACVSATEATNANQTVSSTSAHSRAPTLPAPPHPHLRQNRRRPPRPHPPPPHLLLAPPLVRLRSALAVWLVVSSELPDRGSRTRRTATSTTASATATECSLAPRSARATSASPGAPSARWTGNSTTVTPTSHAEAGASSIYARVSATAPGFVQPTAPTTRAPRVRPDLEAPVKRLARLGYVILSVGVVPDCKARTWLVCCRWLQAKGKAVFKQL